MGQFQPSSKLALFEGFCRKMQMDGLPIEAKVGGFPLKLKALTTQSSQAKGYMEAQKEPTENEGLLFVYDRPLPLNFWMKNVKFPLDIIFFDENRKCLGHHTMQPHNGESEHKLPRYSSKKPAMFAVEVCGGWCERNLKKDSILEF